MPKARKRKLPITDTDPVPVASSSKPESSRAVIRRFHVLLKRQVQLQKSTQTDVSKKTELDRVEEEIEQLGGLENYQRMSTIGQGSDRGGGSQKVLVNWLKEKRMHRTESKLRLLEVGALKPDNYKSYSDWMQVTPIDLNSRHPSILEQDFLLLDKTENLEAWDIISLSLVLNFVPEPTDRGRMLCLTNHFLVQGGYLFVALPLPCLSNSRYLDFERFEELMIFLGFMQVQQQWKKGGKMIYYLFQKETNIGLPPFPEYFTKKTTLRQGDRNNFSIRF